MAKPQGLDLIPLSPAAMKTATQFGRQLARLEPRSAAHLAGVLYTTALPEEYRSTHGIFYTPPQLVDRLLSMAEDAGVDWRTARVLDPACGGGAFLLSAALRMVAALEGANPTFILQQLSARLHGLEMDPFGARLAQAALELALQGVTLAAKRPLPQLIRVAEHLIALDGTQPAGIQLLSDFKRLGVRKD